MANTAISWTSRKQKSVAMSSTEAEYVALSEAAKEAVHLRAFLSGIIGKQPATTIYNDNQGAGNMARNPVLHGRAKHIDLRYHFIRKVIKKKETKVKYLPTEEMTADVLTKGLSSTIHQNCTKNMGTEH
ncbi:retrovirus-related pol polyprotein from transposon tnt 1-94 [Lasius niger]|uniref:Retrovirus-related pol polyprotein from transposon tnt 1-94 n=1 Tax=Lasius niger TaxID=67767 RepID=A0A0J7JTH7_LASNI|nr:retrovirus-related pol polyprotein from transposon tnt 1-94 [Lasius niger]